MDIKSAIEKRSLVVDKIAVYIDPADQKSIVDILVSLLKRSKADRLEEYIINRLIEAIDSPQEPIIENLVVPPIPPEEKPQVAQAPAAPVKIDKVQVVADLKRALDPQNAEDLPTWIKKSIQFGRDQFGIKTQPKSISSEAFFDWLLENGIIDSTGRQIKR